MNFKIARTVICVERATKVLMLMRPKSSLFLFHFDGL